MFKDLQKQFFTAADCISYFVPSIDTAFVNKTLINTVKILRVCRKTYNIITKNNSVDQICASFLAEKALIKITKPINQVINKKLLISNYSHLTNSYTWPQEPGVYTLIIMYHDAYKAGPHIDLHLSNGTSFIYKVKPDLYNKLSMRNGVLTEVSRQLLINHIRNEILNHSRVPQNLDHSLDEAKISWFNNNGPKGYGEGVTRQEVVTTNVYLLKSKSKSATFYAPILDADRLIYLHELYPSEGNRAPICIIGTSVKKTPKLQEKLHLKLIHSLPKFIDTVGDGTSLIKYDGASTIIIAEPDHTMLFSPRISKITGERINYIGKVPEALSTKVNDKWIVRGELLFRDKRGNYLKAHEISGILNSHELRDPNLKPEIRVYRVEKKGLKTLKNLDYRKNELLLQEFCKSNPDLFKMPEKVDPMKPVKNIEGFVGIPQNSSIDDGYKFKFNGDENDWKIKEVLLKPGPTGRSSGVVIFTSLDSNKEFKLGPGQLGSEKFVNDIMKHPNEYIGKTFKVKSKVGHEGRAAKLIMEHMDK